MTHYHFFAQGAVCILHINIVHTVHAIRCQHLYFFGGKHIAALGTTQFLKTCHTDIRLFGNNPFAVVMCAGRVYIGVHISIAAAFAGVRGVTLLTAGRLCYDIFVIVAKGSGFTVGTGITATLTGMSGAAFFRTGRLCYDILVIMAESIRVSIHVAITALTGMGGITLFRAGGRRYRVSILMHMV